MRLFRIGCGQLVGQGDVEFELIQIEGIPPSQKAIHSVEPTILQGAVFFLVFQLLGRGLLGGPFSIDYS